MLSQQKSFGDLLETHPRRRPLEILAKSLVIPAIYTKFKLIDHKFKLEFCIYIDGITSDLAKKSRDSPDFRRDNIAGPHGSRELNADAKNLILSRFSSFSVDINIIKLKIGSRSSKMN